jgi:hypothetical protein
LEVVRGLQKTRLTHPNLEEVHLCATQISQLLICSL